jgi:surfactin synthase thioesterase subunit
MLPLRHEMSPSDGTTVAVRVYCLPPAGGSATTYLPWLALRPARLDFVVLQRPDRLDGTAADVDSFDAWADAIATEIASANRGDGAPYALVGHSLGGHLAYEVAGRLSIAGTRPPALVVIAGAGAPDREPSDFEAARADPEGFLRALGGTPAEVLDHPELSSLITGWLLSDLELLAAHRYGQYVLECPLLVLHGDDDSLTTPQDGEAWRPRTRGAFRFVSLPGGHFFPFDQPQEALDLISFWFGIDDMRSARLA